MATAKKTSSKKTVKGKTRRRFKTKRGIDHRISNITQRPTKRRKTRKKMTAKQRTAAKLARLRTKKRLTSSDKIWMRKRTAALSAMRKRKTKTTKPKTLKVSSKRKTHKLVDLTRPNRRLARQAAIRMGTGTFKKASSLGKHFRRAGIAGAVGAGVAGLGVAARKGYHAYKNRKASQAALPAPSEAS